MIYFRETLNTFVKRRLTLISRLDDDEFGFSVQRFYLIQTFRQFVYIECSPVESVEYPALVVDFVIDEDESETVYILMNILCCHPSVDFSHTL